MPPKRKAMAEASANELVPTAPRTAKTLKVSSKATAPTSKASTKTKGDAKTKEDAKSKGVAKAKEDAFKYSNATTLSKKPAYLNLQWPNIGDFIDDEDQDMPEDGQTIGDEFCYRVSDLGFPVSEDAMKMCEKLSKEERKRDQDERSVHIYNDWNGYGMQEILANFLKDFDKDVFKKTVSPFKKWAYAEALACFLKSADLDHWMGCDDGSGVTEVINMMGVMVLTCYDVLAEHSLFGPESEVKDIGVITLILLEFLEGDAGDIPAAWGCELVRLCDEAGIELDKLVRKQISVTKESLEELRDYYKEKKTACDLEIADQYDRDGYKAFAMKSNWKPADDMMKGEKIGDFKSEPEKMWFRWEWAVDYAKFKKNHPGGTQYDLTKWSKADLKEYKYGGRSGGG